MHVREEAAERLQYLTFQVAGDEYAVGILRVREIINHREPTRIPMTPPYVPGVINLRGTVVPLVDLGRRFGAPAIAVSKRTCVVIAEVEVDGLPLVLGLLVDAVNEVAELDGAVEPAPAFGLGACTEALAGIGRLSGRFVPILDLDRVLSGDAGLRASLGAEGGGGSRPADAGR